MEQFIKPPLSYKQAEVLIVLARLRAEDTKKAVSLVLVEGMSMTAAAEQVGCSIQSVSNAVKRCLAILKTINEFLQVSLEAEEERINIDN